MNLESLDRHPDLKQAVEDCYEAQDDHASWLMRNHPGTTRGQVSVEVLYHLLLRLLWLGEPEFAESAVVRMDPARQARMQDLADLVSAHGLENVPDMVAARDRAMAWSVLPGVLADDIQVVLESRLRADAAEERLTRLFTEAAAAAARVEDEMGRDAVLFVLGAAQTRDGTARGKGRNGRTS